MSPYNVDMTAPTGQGPDPTHEAAYTRVLRVIRGNKVFIDALIKARPTDLAGNWKLKLVRKNREITTLRILWTHDGEFQAYLREKLAFHYGKEYTEKLVKLFLT